MVFSRVVLFLNMERYVWELVTKNLFYDKYCRLAMGALSEQFREAFVFTLCLYYPSCVTFKLISLAISGTQ